MATIYQNLQSLIARQSRIHFDAERFVQEHITRSWWLTAWLILLTLFTVRFTIRQLAAAPVVTSIVLVVWLVTMVMMVVNELLHQHTAMTLWLKNNLYNSITNAQISLILLLLILAALRGFFNYALANASFTTDPTALGEFSGANWGAVLANMSNLMIFRFPRAETWRIIASILLLVVLAIPSFVVYRQPRFRRSPIRTGLTALWLLSPIMIFFLLRGIGGSGVLPVINPDIAWGGLMLTIIIAIFAIVVSFPLGVVLALGRRSQIRGIPAWLTWTLALGMTAWGLMTSTPENLAVARNNVERILSYWPLFIPIIAYLFQRYFKGNVVAAFSTLYIEFVRGVPLITVLFMAVILFPIFLPSNQQILNTWRVLAGFALFSAAYLAENVRGGLQAIPRGQYEAADALGLNTYQKYRLIILPQALRVVIPAIVGQFIGLFKDTSLIAIVGLFDLLNVANTIAAQPQWLGVRREAYIFIAIIYYIGSAVMAGYSQRLETRLGVGER
jgi:general L-amino acid transport system permease protein